jgi:rhodanese-related sulfurtransferase
MIETSFLKDGIPTLIPRDVLNLKGLQLIDVRRPEEYIGELGHIEGTRLITIGPDLEAFLQTVDKGTALLFICKSGARSAKASAAALELGFTDIYNMEGGMIEWNALSYPVSRT